MDNKTLISFCQKHKDIEFDSPKTGARYTLWLPEEIENLNDEYKIAEFLPGYIGFGSDGGNELLVTSTKDEKIYSVPFIPMNENEAVELAENLEEFSKLKQD